MDDASGDGTAAAVAGAVSGGDGAAQRASRSASPARRTWGWRGPAGRSSCCSTATPRWSPAGSRALLAVFAARAGAGDRRRPAPLSGRLARSGAAAGSRPSPGSSPWRAACPRCSRSLPFYRRLKPLDAPGPARGGLGDGRGDGVPAGGLGGGGPARRGVPLLRPGPRLLPARPAGRLGGRGAAGLPGAPPPRRHHRPRPRRQPPPAARAALERPAALGAQAPRRRAGPPAPSARCGPAPALRLAARALASPFVAAGRRELWRQDGKALRTALAALSPAGGLKPPRLPSIPIECTKRSGPARAASHERALSAIATSSCPGGPGAQGALPPLGHRLRLDDAPAAADDAGAAGGVQLDLPLPSGSPTTRSTPWRGSCSGTSSARASSRR